MELLASVIPEIAAVRGSALRLPTVPPLAAWAPFWIIVGLMILAVSSWWPSVPAVTAMSLVTLGATGVTITRLRGSTLLWPALVHLVVYGGLYALFVGAALHAADTRLGPRLDAITIGDIIVSLVPMLVAGRLVWAAFECAGDPLDRG